MLANSRFAWAFLIWLMPVLPMIQAQNCLADLPQDSLFNCGYTATLVGNKAPGYWSHLCDGFTLPVNLVDAGDDSTFVAISSDCNEHQFVYTQYELDGMGDTLCTDTDTLWVLFQDPSIFEGGLSVQATGEYVNVDCPTGPFTVLCDNSVTADGGGGDPCWTFTYDAFFDFTKIYPEIVVDQNVLDCLAEDIDIISENGSFAQSGGGAGCTIQGDIVVTDPNGDPVVDLTGALSGVLSEASLFFANALLAASSGCLGPDWDCEPEFGQDTIESIFPIESGGHWEYLPAPDSSIILTDTNTIVFDGDTLFLLVDPSMGNPATFTLYNQNWGFYNQYVELTVDWVEDWVYDTAIIVVPTIIPDPDCVLPPCGGGQISFNLDIGPPPGSPCPPITIGIGSEEIFAGAVILECFDNDYIVEITVNGGGGGPYEVIGISGTWVDNNTFISDPLPYGGPNFAEVLGLQDCQTTVSWEPCDCVAITSLVFGDNPITCAQPCVDLFGDYSTGISGPATMFFTWASGGGTVSNDQSAVVCEPGIYDFFVEHIPSGCASINTFQVEAVDVVEAEVSAGEITCANATATLSTDVTFGLGPYTYDWVGPDATPGNNDGAAFEVGLPGTYVLTLEDQETGCQFLDSVEVTLDTMAPILSGTSPLSLPCSGTLTLSVELEGSGNYDFTWSGPGILPGDENLPNPSVTEVGAYLVDVIDQANGCSSQASLQVTPALALEVTAISDPSCLGTGTGTVRVTNVENATGTLNYQLDNGMPQPDPEFQDVPVGTFLVTVTDEAGCIGETTVTIDEVAPLSIELPSEWVFCGEGVAISLEEQVAGLDVDILWPDGSGEPTYQATESGEFTVTVSNQCEELELPFFVDRLLGDPAWQIPNIFTPDGDGTNDVFRVLYDGQVISYQLRIFDRWGEEVFFSENPDEGWDGGLEEQPLPMDTYVWMLDLTLQGCDGPLQVQEYGEVNLMR
jgi:gliding motility-associated-like protein